MSSLKRVVGLGLALSLVVTGVNNVSAKGVNYSKKVSVGVGKSKSLSFKLKGGKVTIKKVTVANKKVVSATGKKAKVTIKGKKVGSTVVSVKYKAKPKKGKASTKTVKIKVTVKGVETKATSTPVASPSTTPAIRPSASASVGALSTSTPVPTQTASVTPSATPSASPVVEGESLQAFAKREIYTNYGTENILKKNELSKDDFIDRDVKDTLVFKVDSDGIKDKVTFLVYNINGKYAIFAYCDSDNILGIISENFEDITKNYDDALSYYVGDYLNASLIKYEDVKKEQLD